MKNTRMLILIGLLLVTGVGGFWAGTHFEVRMAGNMDSASHSDSVLAQMPQKNKKVLYWYDPMVPQQHFNAPGKSPFMDMELIPQYVEDDSSSAGVKIDSQRTQNIGVRTAKVESGKLVSTIQALGTLNYNARALVILQARTNGFIEQVYPHAVGDVVRAGDPLTEMSIPDWVAPQNEWLLLKKQGETTLAAAALNRLTLLGMPHDVIKKLMQTQQAQAHLLVAAPVSGAILALDVRPGMTLQAGQTVATINGLDTVWLDVAVPESQSGRIQLNQDVVATLAAYPGETFTGHVIAILPEADTETRTVKVRAEFQNLNNKFKPGMSAQAQFTITSAEGLLIPTEAIIHTGTRTLVMIVSGNRGYQAQEIETGADGNGKTLVLKGLKTEQDIIISGQFLLDSEANLKGMAALKLPIDEEGWIAATVKKHDEGHVTLEHGDIPALKMPGMTMSYSLGMKGMADAFKAGDPVLVKITETENDYVVTAIRAQEHQP